MTLLRTLTPLGLAILLGWTGAFPAHSAQAGKSLRVFIRAGGAAGGSGASGDARFLQDWTVLLQARGVTATGGMRLPTADELKRTDVLILYAANSAETPLADRRNLEDYLRAGGGMVVLHGGMRSSDSDWFKGLAGGVSAAGGTNDAARAPGRMGLYFGESRHPVIEGLANFDLADERAYPVQLAPEARVLARTFRTAKETVPQMWVLEKRRSRVLGFAPGQAAATFSLPQVRGLLLRGIAWAGRRDVDAFT